MKKVNFPELKMLTQEVAAIVATPSSGCLFFEAERAILTR